MSITHILTLIKAVFFRVTMREANFGRGQVEWALWRSFTITSVTADKEIPKIFRTRIKRLLEIDRGLDLSDTEVPPDADYAFAPPPADDSGETAYRAVDAFCLAIALDLLDAGFKQAEVVFLMRYLRPELEKRFADMLTPPSLIDRQRYGAKYSPHLPSYEENGQRFADKRLFVVLQKVEMTEIIPRAQRSRPHLPVILEPKFCAGVEALGDVLHHLLPVRRRAVTVLELAATAQAVETFLKEAPPIRRGRPKV
jgi:hypothetical protein